MKHVKIVVPIYNSWVWVVSDTEECARLCGAKLGVFLTDEDFYAQGMTVYGRDCNVIWLPVDAEVRTVVHECTHAALNIFHVKGIRCDLDNQEPLAYLMGFLTQAVVDARRKMEKANDSRA